ncbi:hypothetical protein ACWNYI_00015 [Candidatus Vidania fulgoroideorum]
MRTLKIFFKVGNKKNSNINSCLGQNGININNFNKLLINKIKIYKDGDVIRIFLKIFKKDNFKIIIKGFLTSFLIKKYSFKYFNNEKKINKICIKKIIRKNKKNFNTNNKKKINNIILGVAKSMSYSYVK